MIVLGLALPDFNEGCNKKKTAFYCFHTVTVGLISCEATGTRTIMGKYFLSFNILLSGELKIKQLFL
jgi:hypothetical protein